MALIRQYPGEPPKFDALTYRQIEHANNRQGEIVNTKDPNETIHAYDRDTLGRLLHDRITRETGGEVVHTYWSDRWKPLEERIDSANTPARQYLWGERPGHRDELVLRDRDTDGNGTLDERLYATMDYFNGSAVLNTSGAVQERYGYSAYGVLRVMAADFTPKTGSDYDWEFGFQGQFRDEETGWLNYGYRFYVLLLGRWINRDPIGERGGVNLFRFSENCPINGIDRFGTEYQSLGQAAKAACDAYSEIAASRKREFGGALIRCNHGDKDKYYFTASEGKEYSMEQDQLFNEFNPNCPCQQAGWWHVHPRDEGVDYTGWQSDEWFSPPDVNAAEGQNLLKKPLLAILCRPTGETYYYDPATMSPFPSGPYKGFSPGKPVPQK